MSIKLRSHHLLCLLTYAGEGYSPAFIAGFDSIAARISAGEDIVLVAGLDDICRPLLENTNAHCLRESVAKRDAEASEALAGLLGRTIHPGERLILDAGALTHMRKAFLAGDIRKACVGCEWAEACTAIAASGYQRTRLVPKS
jgi:uncharacterized protein